MINGHGNNLYDYTGRIVADFSSNIAFNHRASIILEHLKGRLEVITNYPDPTARLLTEKLARHHGVCPTQILVTNGSAEAFYLIAHLFRQAQTLICTPAFAEYEDACRVFEHQLSFSPLAQIETLLRGSAPLSGQSANAPSSESSTSNTLSGNATSAPLSGQSIGSTLPGNATNLPLSGKCFRTIWLGTPNNPDGRLTSPETLQAICREYPNTYLIADRAYYTLTGNPAQHPSPSAPHPDAPNLISVHSLTKTFAIPGLRLGYLIAAPEIITRLSQMRPPWGVNALALEAGSYILDHYSTLMPAMEELLEESRFLQTNLSRFAGLTIIPSDCNFFLCKLQQLTAPAVKERLIAEYGILIRDCSNFRGLDNSYFRLSAQSRPKNESLLCALKNILEFDRLNHI